MAGQWENMTIDNAIIILNHPQRANQERIRGCSPYLFHNQKRRFRRTRKAARWRSVETDVFGRSSSVCTVGQIATHLTEVTKLLYLLICGGPQYK